MSCSVDCGLYGSCVVDVCVCAAPYTNIAEGIAKMGCDLNGESLTILWMITFVLTTFGFVFCSCKLFVGLFCGNHGDVIWRKVFSDTVFRVVACTAALDFGFALYAAARMFGGYYFVHDYVGVVLYCLPWCVMWAQLASLSRLFRKMVKTLVRATGITDFKLGYRWTNTALVTLGCLLQLPHLAGPLLPPSARVALLRYFLLYVFVMGSLVVYALLSIAEKGISVLKALGTDVTNGPRKKLRGITIYFYVVIVVAFTSMLTLAVSDLIVEAPYLLGAVGVLIGVGPLPRAAMLRFDMSKFRKSKRPSSGSKRDDPTSSTADKSTEKSTVQSSNEKSGEVGPAEVTTPVTANRRLGDVSDAESPVLGGRTLGATAASTESWMDAPARVSELSRESDMPHIIDVGK